MSPAGDWTACVLDYGAQADGVTDATDAFQAALDGAAEKGGLVFVPAGTYLIAGALTVPPGVTLKGVWEAPHHADIGRGTVIYATGHKGEEDGPPLFSLNQSSGVHGMTVFYPEQDWKDIQPYPWCIQGRGMHGSVIDMTLVNPWKGIDFGTHPNELHHIENVFGQPLKLGIYINQTTDVGRVQNVHFNPHAWGRADHPAARFSELKLVEWLNNNFTGFRIGKTDWEYMRDCFCIFSKIGFHFVETEAGSGNAVLTQCGADICPVAVQVDSVQNHSGVAFTNAQIMGTVVIGERNMGPVKFSNSGFWTIEETREQVIMDGRGTVILDACHFNNWDCQNESAPCIRLNAGSAIVSACDFMRNKKPEIVIGEKAKSLVVTGSQFRGTPEIVNQSEDADVQVGLNATR